MNGDKLTTIPDDQNTVEGSAVPEPEGLEKSLAESRRRIRVKDEYKPDIKHKGENISIHLVKEDDTTRTIRDALEYALMESAGYTYDADTHVLSNDINNKSIKIPSQLLYQYGNYSFMVFNRHSIPTLIPIECVIQCYPLGKDLNDLMKNPLTGISQESAVYTKERIGDSLLRVQQIKDGQTDDSLEATYTRKLFSGDYNYSYTLSRDHFILLEDDSKGSGKVLVVEPQGLIPIELWGDRKTESFIKI